jgi:hypothetical protein
VSGPICRSSPGGASDPGAWNLKKLFRVFDRAAKR